MKSEIELIKFIKKYLKSPYKEKVIDGIKVAIKLNPFVLKNNEFVCSKFGGLPNFPKNTKWPMINSNEPYSFIAQINLEEIRKSFENILLPKKGLMCFFVNPKTYSSCKVLHAEEVDCIEKTIPPQIKERTLLDKILGINKSYFIIFPEVKLSPEIDFTIPSYDSLFFEKIYRDGEMTIPPHRAYTSEEYFEFFFIESPKHQMLGYYKGKQNGFMEIFLNNPKYRKLNNLTKKEIDFFMEWTLLLKIDSDPSIGYNWADAGSLLFFIKKEDLKKKDFSNVKMILDTT